MSIRSTSLLLGTGLLLMASSCKKTIENWKDEKGETVYDTLTTLSDSRIIKMEISNTGDDQIIGAINNSTKMITVYLPHYYQLQFMEVNLLLPQDATVTPAVDELVPVFSDSTFKYTVTGKSGDKSVYTVKPVIQQPNMWMDELSSADFTQTYNLNSNVTSIIISGYNFIPSYAVTTLHLTDNTGKEVRRLSEWTGTGENTTTSMRYTITASDTSFIKKDTDYWLEMHCYALKYKMQYPVRFSK